MTLNEETFLRAMRETIAVHIPEEMDVFELEGPTVFQDLCTSGKPVTTDSVPPEDNRKEAGPSIVTALEFIALMWAAYEAIKGFITEGGSIANKLKKNGESDLEEDLVNTLIEELVKHGFTREKAGNIASSSAPKLTALLQDNQ